MPLLSMAGTWSECGKNAYKEIHITLFRLECDSRAQSFAAREPCRQTIGFLALETITVYLFEE